MQEVLEAFWTEDDTPEHVQNLMALDVTRYLNSTGSAGRPSDAARSIVWSYRNLGRDAYVTQWYASRGRPEPTTIDRCPNYGQNPHPIDCR